MALWPILNSNEKIAWNCFFSNITSLTLKYFPGGSDGKSVCLQTERPRFNPWVGKVLWRRKWQPTPVLLPGKFHGLRSLVGYYSWGHKESDITEQLHFSTAVSQKWWYILYIASYQMGTISICIITENVTFYLLVKVVSARLLHHIIFCFAVNIWETDTLRLCKCIISHQAFPSSVLAPLLMFLVWIITVIAIKG